jgi:predicted HTH transcriptional regulator
VNCLIDKCEDHGVGFPKIIAAWKETGWGEPELKNKIEVDEVELVLPVSTATTNVVKDVVKDVVKGDTKDDL